MKLKRKEAIEDYDPFLGKWDEKDWRTDKPKMTYEEFEKERG